MQINNNLAYRLRSAGGAAMIGVSQGGTAQNRFSNAVINVKDAPYNAKGDGVTDDTVAFQAATDALIAIGGGEIYAPRGTYYLSQIDYKSGGITYTGDLGGTTFLKIPSADSFKRMFTRLAPVVVFATDSKVVAWQNITFDGNSANAGPYRGYQLEHQHMIHLAGDPAGAGRLRAMIDHCVFKNCVADGIQVYTNVNAEISDCMFSDCFRGSVTITGGYSRAKISNCDAQGAIDMSRLDIEVDGDGYGVSKVVDVEITNFHSVNGFDFSTSGNSTLVCVNLTSDLTDKSACTFGSDAGDTHNYSNSVFYMGEADSFLNRIINGGAMRFSSCDFEYFRPSTLVGNKEFGIYVYPVGANTRLNFNDCRFNKDASIVDADTVWAVRQIPANLALGHMVTLRDCNIGSRSLFDFGIWTRGNTCRVINTTINAVCPFNFDSFDQSYIYMQGVRLGSGATKFCNVVSAPGVTLEFDDVQMTKAQSGVTVDYAFVGNTYLGHRTIITDDAPTGAEGKFIGDVITRRTPLNDEYNSHMLVGYSGPDSVWSPFNYLGIMPQPVIPPGP